MNFAITKCNKEYKTVKKETRKVDKNTCILESVIIKLLISNLMNYSQKIKTTGELHPSVCAMK